MSRFYGRNTIVYATEHYFQESEVQQLLPYRGCWICEAHFGQFLWKQGLQDEFLFSSSVTCAVLVL
jgi:hypothetical protein